MAAFTETTGATHEALPVRAEPCASFCLARDAACPACAVCGWLEDDHGGPEAPGGAVVTELPTRVAPMPQRLAS